MPARARGIAGDQVVACPQAVRLLTLDDAELPQNDTANLVVEPVVFGSTRYCCWVQFWLMSGMFCVSPSSA